MLTLKKRTVFENCKQRGFMQKSHVVKQTPKGIVRSSDFEGITQKLKVTALLS